MKPSNRDILRRAAIDAKAIEDAAEPVETVELTPDQQARRTMDCAILVKSEPQKKAEYVDGIMI